MKIIGRNLLVVEDDPDVASELREYCSAENTVKVTDTVKSALALLSGNGAVAYDAIILDIVLPDGSGLDILKERPTLPPVLILSSLGDDDSVISGLSVGAADYVIKPCSTRLIEARLALRLLPAAKAEQNYNGLTVNPVTRMVVYNGTQIPLTSSEFNILYFLTSHQGSFFSSDELYEEIWHAKSLNTATIRKHISSMRRKLIEYAPNRIFILTDFGKGYAFVSGE